MQVISFYHIGRCQKSLIINESAQADFVYLLVQFQLRLWFVMFFENGKLVQRIEEQSLIGITDRQKIHQFLIS